MKSRDEYMQEIRELAGDILDSPKYLETKNFIQHGNVSVYAHCVSVTVMCLKIADKTGWKVDRETLVRGALLHDYFLYDWHDDEKWHHLHGFTHAFRAMKNAQHDFGLNRTERNMIYAHMFPLNLTHIPLHKESMILCIADKIVGTKETAKGKGNDVNTENN